MSVKEVPWSSQEQAYPSRPDLPSKSSFVSVTTPTGRGLAVTSPSRELPPVPINDVEGGRVGNRGELTSPPAQAADTRVGSHAPACKTADPSPLITDYFCEDCFAPCRMTDRGPFCDTHYGAHRPLCEVCGQHPAEIIESGYEVCLNAYCRRTAIER